MIPKSDILIVLEDFTAVGKTKRSFRLADKDETLIKQRFAAWLFKNTG